jgi:hypothetical protein
VGRPTTDRSRTYPPPEDESAPPLLRAAKGRARRPTRASEGRSGSAGAS